MKQSLFAFTIIISTVLVPSFKGWTQNDKHDIKISFGAFSGYGYPNGLPGTTSGIPTLNLTGEYFLNKFFSLGGYTSYTYSFDEFENPQSGYKDVWKGWDVGVKTNFYISPFFKKNEKIDLYLTGFFGYTTRSLVYDKSNIYRDSLNYSVDATTVGAILGFRYFINTVIGFYFEAGLSRNSFLGAGVSFNIKNKQKSP